MLIEIVNPAERIHCARPLVEAHMREYGYGAAFDPNVELYDAAFKAGRAFAVHAVDGSESLGYCSVIISPSMHSKTLVQAGCDGLFVRPDKRGSLLAGRIVRAAEEEAKRRGCHQFMWVCKAGTGIVGAFLRRGYVEHDVVLMKVF